MATDLPSRLRECAAYLRESLKVRPAAPLPDDILGMMAGTLLSAATELDALAKIPRRVVYDGEPNVVLELHAHHLGPLLDIVRKEKNRLRGPGDPGALMREIEHRLFTAESIPVIGNGVCQHEHTDSGRAFVWCKDCGNPVRFTPVRFTESV